jgi:hypothetical protein
MSVVVSLNSMELLVDLMRFPGQLIPFSAKAIFISHISAAGESDSAENDSCDSPLEPNSPLYGLSDKVEAEGYAYVLNISSRLCDSGLVYVSVYCKYLYLFHLKKKKFYTCCRKKCIWFYWLFCMLSH